ncbi:hypothetical protein D3230_13490, partial [Leucobacter chromiireducens subsp. solipictus]
MTAHTPPRSTAAPITRAARSHRSRGALLTSAAFAAALCVLPAGAAFAAAPGSEVPATARALAATPSSPAELLASTAWETTAATDQNGAPVALDDPAVA